MVKLKVIAFFLSLLMVMQMLPLRQIGKVLASNQWTEELPHDADEAGKDPTVKFNHPLLPPANYTSISSVSETKALAYIHHSQQIPSNHSTEVVTPPPDSVSYTD